MATAHPVSLAEECMGGLEPVRNNLVPILARIQERCAFLPQDALRAVSRRLRLPLSEIRRVARDEGRFDLTPRGRHRVEVCGGISCGSLGSDRIHEEALDVTCADRAGTSADGEFSIQRAECCGRCAEGPVVVVDGSVYIGVEPHHIAPILAHHRDTPCGRIPSSGDDAAGEEGARLTTSAGS